MKIRESYSKYSTTQSTQRKEEAPLLVYCGRVGEARTRYGNEDAGCFVTGSERYAERYVAFENLAKLGVPDEIGRAHV